MPVSLLAQLTKLMFHFVTAAPMGVAVLYTVRARGNPGVHVAPRTMTQFHFIRFYRPQFGGPVRNDGRVTVTAANQSEAHAAILASASPTERATSYWLPRVGCASRFGY